MAVIKSLLFASILFFIIPVYAFSQSRLKPFVNTGYITNLRKGDDAVKADRGGSIRIGILNKGLFGNGRFGFYGGYLWFKEFNEPNEEYDDKGRMIVAGFDILALKREKSNWYIKIGIGREKFYSIYRATDRIEYEINYKPDFGVLYNIKNFNAYLGWQPSDPHHFNLGIGFTLDTSIFIKNSGY